MKVFVVKINVVCDYEVCEDQVRLFVEEDKAREYFNHRKETLAKEADDNNWEVEGNNACSNELDCYEDGYYAQNHLNVSFSEAVLEIPVELLKAELEKLQPTSDRTLAMRQMEQELIEIVKENGEDNELCIEELYLSWSEECDGECCTKNITGISIKKMWDGSKMLHVCFDGKNHVPFYECDQDDLGHNLADYIYNEIKTYY